MAWLAGCGPPAAAPGAAATSSASASAAVEAKPFVGRFPADCDQWPYGLELKAELIEKAVGLLEGLQGTRSRALLERIHPGGLRMVQILADPDGNENEIRETLVLRSGLLQHFAEGGGAWLLEGFAEPVRVYRRPRVGAHWDVLDGRRQLCVGIQGTEGMFDGKPYVVLYTTEREQNEGQNAQVVVLFERDASDDWLPAAVVRPWQQFE